MKYILTYKLFEDQTRGLESSVMPHTQFNNMTNRLYPQGQLNRQDDYHNKLRRETDFILKNSKEILKDVPKKKKRRFNKDLYNQNRYQSK